MFGMSLQKRLRFEFLEDKIAPANLSVAVVDGDLLITGDSGDNVFSLSTTVFTSGDQYRISLNGMLGDTINGVVVEDDYIINGVTRDVIIDLGEGNDAVYILGEPTIDNSRDFTVPRDMIITGGGGNDVIAVGVSENDILTQDLVTQFPIHVLDDLSINGGEGDDSIWVTGTTTEDDFTITDTQGNNFVQFLPEFLYFSIVARSSEAHGNFSLTTGSGADVVEVADVIASGNLSVSVGGGDDVAVVDNNDVAGNITLSLGAGMNQGVVEQSIVAGNVSVGGSGTNDIIVQNMTIGSSLNILTNNNDDNVFVFSVTADSTLIATRGGSDNVQLLDSAFDLMLVQLGAGDDTLNLTGVDALLSILIGGGGTDTYQNGGDNVLTLALDMGFEIFE